MFSCSPNFGQFSSIKNDEYDRGFEKFHVVSIFWFLIIIKVFVCIDLAF